MLRELDAVVRASLSSPAGVSSEDGAPVFPEARDREILGWATLLHDVGKPPTLQYADRIRFHGHDHQGAEMAAEILTRMRRPGKVCRDVVELVRQHMRFMHIREMRVAKRRRFVQSALFPLHLALHRFDCLASHRDFTCYDFALEAWREEQRRPPPRRPLLTGADLLAVGYVPGPRLGRILRAVDDARLEGTLSSRDEALEWVRKHFPGKER
jgi:poly(A) polymerase